MNAAAQEKRSFDGDVKDVVDDVWSVVRAPLSPTGEDLVTTGAVLGGAGLLLLVDAPAQDWVRAHPNAAALRVLAPFRNGGVLEPIGRTTILAPLAGAAWILGAAFEQEGLRDAGAGCLAANLANLAARSVVTMIAPRARPQEHRGSLEFDLGSRAWPMQSLPSGHASNPMSCVSFLVHRFDAGPAEPLLYAIPLAAGLARLPDEAHWLSDTYLGLAMGYAIGRAVAGRSLDRHAERDAELPLLLTVSVRF